MPWNYLKDLEALLRFFHVTLRKHIPPMSPMQTLGGCDSKCPEMVYNVVKENETKHRRLSVSELAVNMRDQLLRTTANLIEEMG